jgi:hypothetical protein
MSELVHSEIPVSCEIAAITIWFAGCSGFVTRAPLTPLELDLLAKPRQKCQRTPHHADRGPSTGPIGRGDEAFGKVKRDCLVRIDTFDVDVGAADNRENGSPRSKQKSSTLLRKSGTGSICRACERSIDLESRAAPDRHWRAKHQCSPRLAL